MILLTPHALGGAATTDMFGGNILAPRTAMTGEGSYADAVEGLGVTGLRWPGGSLTEYTLDLSDPDNPRPIAANTGEPVDYIPLSELMAYAEDNGHAVTIVLPTRTMLGEETDEFGNRLPDIDEETLSQFITDVAMGVYGDATVAGFEIGNEYWGSGEMNAVEYGELSSKMAGIVDSALQAVPGNEDVNVYVQMGHNYGSSRLNETYDGWQATDVIDDLLAKYPDLDISYDDIRGSGEVNWTTVNNEMVQMAFDTEEEQDSIDGLIAHVYSRGEDNPNSRYYDLSHIQNDWLGDEGFDDLDILVSEWNQKSTDGLNASEDYGLKQAHEMLNIMESFMDYGVDAAHVWPLIQNTKNALSRGFEFEESTAAGDMFSIMSETLPGKKLVDFVPRSRETEYEGDHADIHGFYGDNSLTLFIASTSEDVNTTDIDMSGLLTDYESVRIRTLGVEEGQNPYAATARGVVEDIPEDEALEDGMLTSVLGPGEIMIVEFSNITPTESFAAMVAEDDDDVIVDEEDDDTTEEDDGDIGIPTVPIDEHADDHDTDEDEDHSDDDGGFDIGGALLAALIPLLLLGGLAM